MTLTTTTKATATMRQTTAKCANYNKMILTIANVLLTTTTVLTTTMLTTTNKMTLTTANVLLTTTNKVTDRKSVV